MASDRDSSRAGDSAGVMFRRPTAADARELAREAFLANERVDMQTLSTQLGIGRTTLHRWVHTREALLDGVLGDLARQISEHAGAHAKGDDPERVVAEYVANVVDVTVHFQPVRGFVAREPELALKLLLGKDLRAHSELVAGLSAVIAAQLPDEAEQLERFVDVAVEVATSLEWPAFIAGHEVAGADVADVLHALLVAARAGALPRV